MPKIQELEHPRNASFEDKIESCWSAFVGKSWVHSYILIFTKLQKIQENILTKKLQKI